MTEFYDGRCSYQKKAQPYLEAIARNVKDNPSLRSFVLEGTQHQHSFADAKLLWQEQWEERDPSGSMICPFWTNYWYNPCQSCDCRIDKSVSMEIDAMFFLQNAKGKRLAVHIEMKRDSEPLSIGQAEAYRPRAACYQEQRRLRKGLLPHDEFVTVLFYGIGTDVSIVTKYFDRVISHQSARDLFPGYPTG